MTMISELCEEVKLSIEGGTFSQPFNKVQVAMVPIREAKDSPLTATINVESYNQAKTARCKWARVPVIRLIISDFVPVANQEDLVLDLLDLCEEVYRHLEKDLSKVILTSGTAFTLSEITNDPLYDYNAVLEESTFLSVITLSFTGID